MMRPLFIFMEKEWIEGLRSSKLMILVIVFVFIGILNPATAKLIPWMFEVMADSFEELGMTVSGMKIDAMTSWTQFFKNIPMALIAFLLIFSNSFTKEYQSGTLILVLTKGLPRNVVVLAKSLFMLISWTVGYWMCFGITYAYNAYFWDNSIANNLFFSAAIWYLFGLLTVCLLILFSVLQNNSGEILLEVGLCVIVGYVLKLIPVTKKFSVLTLTDTAALLAGTAKPDSYIMAIVISLVLDCICIGTGVVCMNKKQL
ncbi:MAG: type transport system permease protein [Clostridiales bacterium]|nr:type transport system permease protein [Clostridiales bacterium]